MYIFVLLLYCHLEIFLENHLENPEIAGKGFRIIYFLVTFILNSLLLILPWT